MQELRDVDEPPVSEPKTEPSPKKKRKTKKKPKVEPPPPPPPPDPVKAQRLTNICAFGMALVATPANSYPYLARKMEDSMLANGDDESISDAPIALSFGIVVAILTVTPFATRIGARPFLLSACACVTFGFLLQCVSTNVLFLSFATFMEGLGVGILDLLLTPTVAALNPEARRKSICWIHACFSLSAIGTILTTMTLTAIGFDWRVVVAILIVPPAALLLCFYQYAVDLPDFVKDGNANETPFALLLGNRIFITQLLLMFLAGCLLNGPTTFVQVLLSGPSMQAPSWVGTFSFVILATTITGGRFLAGSDLGEKLTAPLWLTIGGALTVSFIFLLCVLPFIPLVVLCCIGLGIGISAMWPTVLALAADAHPNGGIRMYGCLAVFGNAGGAIMPTLAVSVARSSASLPGALALCEIPAVAMLFLGLYLHQGSGGTLTFEAVKTMIASLRGTQSEGAQRFEDVA